MLSHDALRYLLLCSFLEVSTTLCCLLTWKQNELVAQLIETPEKAADLDPRVLDAYIQECTAEAQEG